MMLPLSFLRCWTEAGPFRSSGGSGQAVAVG